MDSRPLLLVLLTLLVLLLQLSWLLDWLYTRSKSGIPMRRGKEGGAGTIWALLDSPSSIERRASLTSRAGGRTLSTDRLW